MKLWWAMRGKYTYPSELSSKSLKNIELVQTNFVPGQSGIDILMGNWWVTFMGRRRKKNEKIMKHLWKQMHLEKKSVYIFFSFDHENYIAGIFHYDSWYNEKLKSAERHQCNHQLIKMFHFLQHVEVITTLLLLCLDGNKFLVLGNIRKTEFDIRKY